MPNPPRLIPSTPARPRRSRGTTAERGYGAEHQRQRRRLLAEHPLCQLCGERFATDLHHRDGHPHNHADSNALMVCEECHHRTIHGKLAG